MDAEMHHEMLWLGAAALADPGALEVGMSTDFSLILFLTCYLILFDLVRSVSSWSRNAH